MHIFSKVSSQKMWNRTQQKYEINHINKHNLFNFYFSRLFQLKTITVKSETHWITKFQLTDSIAYTVPI